MNSVKKTSWQVAAVTAATLLVGGIAQAHDRGHAKNQRWHNQGGHHQGWHDRGSRHQAYHSGHRYRAAPPRHHWQQHRHYRNYAYDYGSYPNSNWGYAPSGAQFIVTIPLH